MGDNADENEQQSGHYKPAFIAQKLVYTMDMHSCDNIQKKQ